MWLSCVMPSVHLTRYSKNGNMLRAESWSGKELHKCEGPAEVGPLVQSLVLLSSLSQ